MKMPRKGGLREERLEALDQHLRERDRARSLYSSTQLCACFR